MLFYKYKALDNNKKIVLGLVEAINENEAVDILRDRGLEIISLEFHGRAKSGFNVERFFSHINAKDLVIFARQFSVLISANVAMVQSLKVMVDQTENIRLKEIIADIRGDVDGGTSLSESLAKHNDVFNNFFINVIKSGESSGKLDEVLNYLADETEKEYDMMSKIKGAMIYPVFILVLMIGVGIFLMVNVVPQLTQMLTESGVALPLPTRILIALSKFLNRFWVLLVAALVGGFFAIKYFFKTPQGKIIKDKALLRLPIFGKLFQKIYLVRFTRSLTVLLVGGVNLTKGLRITSEVVNNTVYRDLIDQTIKEVEEGNSISTIFMHSPEIPKMVSQMLVIGEKTGKIDVILQKITDFYEREISNIVANIMSLMEPIIMVAMGIGVGTMVVAIVLPMLQVSQNM